MTLEEALALYDADNEDPRIDEAVEYCGQIPDNVRRMRLPIAQMLVTASEEGAIEG